MLREAQASHTSGLRGSQEQTQAGPGWPRGQRPGVAPRRRVHAPFCSREPSSVSPAPQAPNVGPDPGPFLCVQSSCTRSPHEGTCNPSRPMRPCHRPTPPSGGARWPAGSVVRTQLQPESRPWLSRQNVTEMPSNGPEAESVCLLPVDPWRREAHPPCHQCGSRTAERDRQAV